MNTTNINPASLLLSLQRYDKVIRDPRQPLLISKAKARDVRGGEDSNILLIPELCRATGITDPMRANFRYNFFFISALLTQCLQLMLFI